MQRINRLRKTTSNARADFIYDTERIMGNDMSGRGVGKYVNSIKSICVCFTSTAAC